MKSPTGTDSRSSLRWIWLATLVAAALAALETQRLLVLIRWERTLPFARDLLPGAIATASMTLAAYLFIIALVFVRRTRKWGLALGIAWGAIIMGSSLWVIIGPHVKNVWQELLLRSHLTNALIQYGSIRGSQRATAAWLAGLGALLAAISAKAFIDRPRDRLDRGVVAVSIFYAALYYLAIAFVARLVTPH